MRRIRKGVALHVYRTKIQRLDFQNGSQTFRASIPGQIVPVLDAEKGLMLVWTYDSETRKVTVTCEKPLPPAKQKKK
jgi:hypothetical protein